MTTIPQTQISVVGTDGKVPIYNPEGRFQIYKLSEIFVGQQGEARYVPNVDDLVVDVSETTSSRWYRVVSLSVDLIPTLRPWGDIPQASLDSTDVLTGVGPNNINNNKFVYLDTSVTPHVLAVDARLSFKGTSAKFVRIVKSNGVGLTPSVISCFYDNSGNLLGNDVPLELVGVNGQTQRSEYTVPVCYTMEKLPDNEVVTVIAYSAAGHVVSHTDLYVRNTSFIRQRNLSTKYITHISMVTPFMSETDNKLINLPVNVPLQGLYPMGYVHYSDGSKSEPMPVDGTKFTLHGMSDYLATQVNQRIPVVLTYRLSEEEVVYGAERGEFVHVSQNYNIRTIQSSGAYNVKLFGFPEWQGDTQGYRMRWWLYNSDRNMSKEVTDLVQLAINNEPWNPHLYGVVQSLNVQVNLNEVNPIYENWRHSQVVQVLLRRPGTERSTNWTIAFDPGQSPAYGDNTHVKLEFINYNYYKLNLAGTAQTRDEWLEMLYKRAKPIWDGNREMEAPLPTHFRIKIGNTVLERPISEWNLTHSVLNGLEVNRLVVIEWISKTPETDLELGVSGVIAYPGTNL